MEIIFIKNKNRKNPLFCIINNNTILNLKSGGNYIFWCIYKCIYICNAILNCIDYYSRSCGG